ncbi:hypothetical protein B932_2497 [Gluconobacter oxydans H24]|nr:hypothetical protein B932_2497 [Gluconobacter oxydans H24]GAC86874.1 hypothetical protein NBRC3255_0535 [Gluconobacter thailandicus NBRC 3255]
MQKDASAAAEKTSVYLAVAGHWPASHPLPALKRRSAGATA